MLHQHPSTTNTNNIGDDDDGRGDHATRASATTKDDCVEDSPPKQKRQRQSYIKAETLELTTLPPKSSVVWDKFKTFRVQPNSKNPTSDWTKQNQRKSINRQDKGDKYNSGVPCGKVNDVFGVDLDLKDDKKGEFLERWGNVFLTWTYAIQTPSKGYHLYFQHIEGERSNIKLRGYIDVRTNNAYLVGEGSSINGQMYKKANDIDAVNPIPEEFYEWMFEFQKKKVPKRQPGSGESGSGDAEGDADAATWAFYMHPDEMQRRVNKLDADVFIHYDKWFKWTTTMKAFDNFDLWDETNKKHPKYDRVNNTKIWESAKPSYYETSIGATFGIEMKKVSAYKYRPVLPLTIDFDLTIDVGRLNDYAKPFFSQDHPVYLVKSDTGTGKSHAFRQYISSMGQPFVSIVNRITLGTEQYRAFSQEGMKVKFHHIQSDFVDGDSAIITIESLGKLVAANFDFSKYVVFLDEINSLLKHLVMSPTVKCKFFAMQWFTQLCRECKQIIATDAHVSDCCLEFLQRVRPHDRPFTILNKHKHFAGKKVIRFSFLHLIMNCYYLYFIF